ncbi:MAG: FAD-dependent oxidoreductase [Tardiphaga sp.]|jgi:thioredoxin reductase|nr:FAD-dependent oxidoreductase [Tardiphaga sp.]
MTKTVAIVGAGPVGLAAAAHVLARGMTPIVLEAGCEVGHAVRQWRHVQLFSPWQYNIDDAAARLLTTTGWEPPAWADYPTGGELVERYLQPLATATALAAFIRTSSRVTEISRVGLDKLETRGRAAAPFELRYRDRQGPATLLADAVIDASGTWHSPNPAGANGLKAIGESEAADSIAYAMPDVLGRDRARYAGKTVAVLGAGHSALGTLTDLARLRQDAPDTRPIWLLRGSDPAEAFGGGANDQLAARGELGATFAALVAAGVISVETEFRVARIDGADGRLRVLTGTAADQRHVTVDELIVATGFRPDFSFARELRIQLDPAIECPVALAPLIDPNEHSCGTVRPHGARELQQSEPGYYLAGMKSYGRAPTFLMITGYEQVRSIAADIAGDHADAARVQLTLPETGVCNRSVSPVSRYSGATSAVADSACCGMSTAAHQEKHPDQEPVQS